MHRGPAAAPADPHAGRGRVPVALRAALAVAPSPRASASAGAAGGPDAPPGLRARGVADRAIRWQLQLAWPDLVSAQRAGARVVAQSARISRRSIHCGASDSLGGAGAPRTGGRRT